MVQGRSWNARGSVSRISAAHSIIRIMIRNLPRPARTRLSTRAVQLLLAGVLATISSPALLDAQIEQREYAARREALGRAMPGDGVLLVRGSSAPERDYMAFHQTPALNYLTGFAEPDASLVMERRGGRVSEILFVRERNPEREIWEGRSLGTEGASSLTGMQVRPREALEQVLDSLLANGGTLFVTDAALLAGFPGSGAAGWRPPEGTHVRPLMQELRRLRGTKSAAELELIRRAVAITVEAQRDAMRLVEPGLNEFEVEALIEYTFRRYGAARPAFASIVGSGPNSTSLHYNQNDRFMRDGETVVIDVGANYLGYSADVTRTLPVNGRFTAEQRHIYQTVRSAQNAAEREARVGVSFGVLSQVAAQELARGLTEAGLIDSPDARYECSAPDGCMQYRLYYMHGLGHGIGLEVHDPDQWEFGRIGVNSVFTIEPGLYVREDALDMLPDTPANRQLRQRLAPAVAKYANIGVRIEDDYIIGPDGAEWISRAPRELDEVEAMMAQPWTGPSERKAEMVEWWRDGR